MTTIKDLEKRIKKLEGKVLTQGRVIERVLDFLKDLGYEVSGLLEQRKKTRSN